MFSFLRKTAVTMHRCFLLGVCCNSLVMHQSFIPSSLQYSKQYNENELRSHANVGHKKLEKFEVLSPLMLMWQQNPYCLISRISIPQTVYACVIYSEGAFCLIPCMKIYIIQLVLHYYYYYYQYHHYLLLLYKICH